MNYQKLFDYMSKEHGVTLLETNMQEIIRIVKEMEADEPTKPTEIGTIKHIKDIDAEIY